MLGVADGAPSLLSWLCRSGWIHCCLLKSSLSERDFQLGSRAGAGAAFLEAGGWVVMPSHLAAAAQLQWCCCRCHLIGGCLLG